MNFMCECMCAMCVCVREPVHEGNNEIIIHNQQKGYIFLVFFKIIIVIKMILLSKCRYATINIAKEEIVKRKCFQTIVREFFLCSVRYFFKVFSYFSFFFFLSVNNHMV